MAIYETLGNIENTFNWTYQKDFLRKLKLGSFAKSYKKQQQVHLCWRWKQLFFFRSVQFHLICIFACYVIAPCTHSAHTAKIFSTFILNATTKESRQTASHGGGYKKFICWWDSWPAQTRPDLVQHQLEHVREARQALAGGGELQRVVSEVAAEELAQYLQVIDRWRKEMWRKTSRNDIIITAVGETIKVRNEMALSQRSRFANIFRGQKSREHTVWTWLRKPSSCYTVKRINVIRAVKASVLETIWKFHEGKSLYIRAEAKQPEPDADKSRKSVRWSNTAARFVFWRIPCSGCCRQNPATAKNKWTEVARCYIIKRIATVKREAERCCEEEESVFSCTGSLYSSYLATKTVTS